MIKAPIAPTGSPSFAIAIVRDLTAWVSLLIRLPQPRKVYTITTLPPAADNDGATVPISDGVASKPTATSVNGLWKYPDGATV